MLLYCGTHLDSVERSTGALGVELGTPDLLARLRSGDDTLDGRVVAVDEEGGPAFGEVLGQSQGVLVVLRLYH